MLLAYIVFIMYLFIAYHLYIHSYHNILFNHNEYKCMHTCYVTKNRASRHTVLNFSLPEVCVQHRSSICPVDCWCML